MIAKAFPSASRWRTAAFAIGWLPLLLAGCDRTAGSRDASKYSDISNKTSTPAKAAPEEKRAFEAKVRSELDSMDIRIDALETKREATTGEAKRALGDAISDLKSKVSDIRRRLAAVDTASSAAEEQRLRNAIDDSLNTLRKSYADAVAALPPQERGS